MLLDVFLLFIAYISSVSALTFQDYFKPFVTTDLDFFAFATKVGHHDLMSCSVECVARGDGCFAFHRTSAGLCFFVRKTAKGWPEKAGAPVLQLWVRSSKPTCAADQFPIRRGRSRYFLDKSLTTWSQALTKCEAKGSKLAELTSEEENTFITDVLRAIPDVSVYVEIGLKQRSDATRAVEGWTWYLSKEPFIGPWNGGEPGNTNGNQDRGVLKVSVGRYHDTSATSIANSLCECTLM